MKKMLFVIVEVLAAELMFQIVWRMRRWYC